MAVRDAVKLDALELLQRLWDYPEPPRRATSMEIDELGKAIEVPIPDEVREWLSVCNGSGLIGGFYGTASGAGYSIAYVLDLCPDWKAKGWIPVAGDGCGNEYILSTRPEDGVGNPVFFIDSSIDPQRIHYVVASGLWHFLRFIYLDELGDHSWPFDKAAVVSQDPSIVTCTNHPKPWEAEEASRAENA